VINPLHCSKDRSVQEQRSTKDGLAQKRPAECNHDRDLANLVTNFYRELIGRDTLSVEWCLGHHVRSQWWRMSWRERRRYIFGLGITFWRLVIVHKDGKCREMLRGFFNLPPGGTDQ
jgi:hypothetical protein